VDYQHLIDHARAHIERTYRRPLGDRVLRAALAAVLPYPRRVRAALTLARLARSLERWLPAPLQALLDLAPRRRAAAAQPAPREPATSERRARVAVITGCVQAVIAPEINAATIRLLERAGAEVVAIDGCCGALVHHLGRERHGHSFATRLVERLHGELGGAGLDAIVANASGCGTQLKDYGYLLRDDAVLAAKAAVVSAKARDVTETLHELGLPPRSVDVPPLVVAYHSACSMQHGQKLDAVPRALLAGAGFTVKEIAEGHLCCGSAGTYNVLQPALAARLRERKLENVARTGATVVATGNIGCMTQLKPGTTTPVVHTVELLDWATGGPRPPALANVAMRSTVDPAVTGDRSSA
jgi:glycolate oxidase iron-sulfur subunit